MVKFTGILIASVPMPAIAVPDGYVMVDVPHITLLSNEIGKDVRRAIKGMDLACLPAFPNVTFGMPYLADNGTKASVVCDVNEQDEVRAWVESAITALGVTVTMNPERVYHISVANRTGSRYDSVPDPWNCRV